MKSGFDIFFGKACKIKKQNNIYNKKLKCYTLLLRLA